MKSKEKKLIALASAMFFLVLVVRGIPYMRDTYREGLDEIEFMEQRIERLHMLMEESAIIKDEEAAKREEMATLESWVFSGQDPNLVGNSVQLQLRQVVGEAGVLARSYDRPRFAETSGWMLVTQEMDFVIDQANILKFLDLLENTRPKLHVTEFTINRNRRQFLGSITVTGFSKTL